MLAVALVLIHAVPALACASDGEAAGCCGNCDPNTCHITLHAACLDGQPAVSIAVRMHAPAPHGPSDTCGPDCDTIFNYASLTIPRAAQHSLQLESQVSIALPLYLLLQQLRL
jgi:hypothetical protein